MREVITVTGSPVTVDCLGCALANGQLADYPGTIWRGRYVHVHQDIEVRLPGFVIISTIRHIEAIDELSTDEAQEFVATVSAVRSAQRQCGIGRVYLFQNEDSSDHYHVWLFPVLEWMGVYGKGPALLSGAIAELKMGRHIHDRADVLAMVTRLQECLRSPHE